jgi:hypothetical protein
MAAFLGRPAMRELQHLDVYLDQLIDLRDPVLHSDREAKVALADNVREFLRALTNSKGGTQYAETREALRSALAAAVGSSESMKGRKAAFRRILDVQHSAVLGAICTRDGVLLRAAKSGGSAKWECRTRSTYSNKYVALLHLFIIFPYIYISIYIYLYIYMYMYIYIYIYLSISNPMSILLFTGTGPR